MMLLLSTSEKAVSEVSLAYGLASNNYSSAINGTVSIDAGDVSSVGDIIYETTISNPEGLYYKHSSWGSDSGTYIPVTMPSYSLYANLTNLHDCSSGRTWTPSVGACMNPSEPGLAVRVIYSAGGREFVYGNTSEVAFDTGVTIPSGTAYPKEATGPAFAVSGTDSIYPGEFKLQIIATAATLSPGSYKLSISHKYPLFGPGNDIHFDKDNVQWFDKDSFSIKPSPPPDEIADAGPPHVTSVNPGLPVFLGNVGSFSGTITVNVTTTTCAAILDNIDVDLGVNSTSLSSSPLVPFNIGFTCSDPSLILKPEMTFTAEEGTGGSADLILNRLVSSDAATGAGVELLDKNGVQIPLNEPYAYPDTIDLGSLGGEGQLEFNARLVALPGKTPTAGKYESVATLAVDYP